MSPDVIQRRVDELHATLLPFNKINYIGGKVLRQPFLIYKLLNLKCFKKCVLGQIEY